MNSLYASPHTSHGPRTGHQRVRNRSLQLGTIQPETPSKGRVDAGATLTSHHLLSNVKKEGATTLLFRGPRP